MAAKKISGKQLQAAETIKKIYESADLLFKEYGFENVSVDAIVEKAGISKGGFYVHFHSKDDLIATLLPEYVGKLDLSYKSYLESFANDVMASDILLSLVEKIADNITANVGHDLIKLVYRLQMNQHISTDALLSYNRDIYGILGGIIQRGIRQGEFKEELGADVAADQFVTVIRGFTYEWCIRYPEFHLKNELLRHFNLLLSGIRK